MVMTKQGTTKWTLQTMWRDIIIMASQHGAAGEVGLKWKFVFMLMLMMRPPYDRRRNVCGAKNLGKGWISFGNKITTPKYVWMVCPSCEQQQWDTIHKMETSKEPTDTMWKKPFLRPSSRCSHCSFCKWNKILCLVWWRIFCVSRVTSHVFLHHLQAQFCVQPSLWFAGETGDEMLSRSEWQWLFVSIIFFECFFRLRFHFNKLFWLLYCRRHKNWWHFYIATKVLHEFYQHAAHCPIPVPHPLFHLTVVPYLFSVVLLRTFIHFRPSSHTRERALHLTFLFGSYHGPLTGSL